MNERYLKIIDKERVYSEKHPKMSNKERAGQFAPFAALVGYEEAAAEMAQKTCAEYDGSGNSNLKIL